ncbi:MAG TPA: CDP-archaeol synthase [Candidatus Saccharimonadales bacterium]|nr:CDP-archaeol synthase [Candidatus Saccharimonadales bacterium]
MLNEILFALWFFLPAGVANMIPVPVAKIPGLNKLNAPLDFGATLNGKRVFGANKTWRGLIAGVIVATFTLWVQQHAMITHEWFGELVMKYDYDLLPTLLLGPLFAVGALGGDAIKSFFKRQNGIAPGSVWLPYDLIDHIVGAAIISLPFIAFSGITYIVVITIWAVLNLAVSYGGYLLHIKERPY